MSSWEIFDSLYHPAQYFASHLDSYGHYLSEYGESVTRCCLANAPMVSGERGWESPAEAFAPGEGHLDYAFFLDGYQHALRVEGSRVKRIAQVAAVCSPMPWEVRWTDGSPVFDLIVSSIPTMVAQARAAGCRAEFQRLCFDARTRSCGMGVTKDIDCLFVGTVDRNHQKRANILAELGDLVTVAPPTFGRAYYFLVSRAKTLVHVSAAWAAGARNALRLYEGCGLGAFVVSDGPTTLTDKRYDGPGAWAETADGFRARIKSFLGGDYADVAYGREQTADVLMNHVYECDDRVPQLVRWAREL